jgi:type IV secretion system protein VirB4
MAALGRGFWQRKERLAEWLPWLLPLNHGQEIILTTAGGLLRVARYDAPDFETASPESLLAHLSRTADAFARFGNGWSVWLDQWRVKSPGYLPACDFGGCLAAQLVDASRRRHFHNAAKPVFANTAFIAVHYLPQRRDALLAWMMDRADSQVAANVQFFIENTDALFGQLAHTLRGVAILRRDELASYLAASVTYEPKRTLFPSGVLAERLATREWHTAPSLRIDQRYLETVEVRNFGSPSPLTVEALHELPFECRWTTTFHGLDPDERRREILEVRKRWLTKQKGLGAILTEIVTKNPFAGRTDPEADRALAQLDVLQGELAERPYALAHMNVHVWGSTADEAHERAARVASLLNAQGLEARTATLNNVYAPLADMPGNVTHETMNIRRAREEMAAIVRLAPLTGVSTGSRTDWRFAGPALLVGTTRRGVPLYWSLNAAGSDSAHTGIIGRTGAGKSALLAVMAAQFLRYPDARVILFDRRRSFMVPCLAMGGDWIELGGRGRGVQPLRAVDRPEELAWAHDWVIKALRSRGLAIQPHTEAAVTEALSHVADLPPGQRTLTRLQAFLAGDDAARKALQVYLAGQGPYGLLFDGVVESYGEAAVMGIETQEVMQLEAAAPLAISAMFRALRRDRLTGDAPKLVIIDEAWSLLQSELFAGEIEAWAREMRKLKAALVLATQSLADLADGRMRVIFDQLGNKVYLPHAEALRPQTRELYERAGLLEEQIRVLAGAVPKAEYLLQTEEVTRLVEIRLEDEALRLCGASTPVDHARALALLAEGVRPGADFTRHWLAQTTAEWLAGQGGDGPLARAAA